MILYRQLKYPYYMIWYHTIYQHHMISAWWDMMPGWCIIVMRVDLYDIKPRNISIIWCISAIWYISMTWHDSSMIYYSVSNLGNWYHDFSAFWSFGELALRCSSVRCFGVWGFHQTMQSYWRDYRYERFRTTKKSKILSRRNFSSLLVRNDTTQLGASFIVDVYLLLRF